MFKNDITRSIQEMSAKYETEKKQQQIDLQESQLATKDAKIKQQKILRNALIGGTAGFIIIIIVIVIAYVQKKKDNKRITVQKEKIQKASEELRQLYEITNNQKEEIISSIQYAKRIQSAILPPKIIFDELFSENFIYYKPKEIVSGDFYWIRKIKNFTILVVADCTGHGVPGAMMSMLGMSYLNEIVNKNSAIEANQILNELRKKIKNSLRQKGTSAEPKDGMDLSLCIFDNNNKLMQYSGAINPIYLIRKRGDESVLEEIKGDPMPVGVHLSHDTSFSNHLIQLNEGDVFYLFSDGYFDQNGGNNNHRFTTGKFKNLLFEIHNNPMPVQMEFLDKTIKEWMGIYPQRDDILVLGVRIT
jgi:serine phosphatase RsbU (regulator of sigma subunit)